LFFNFHRSISQKLKIHDLKLCNIKTKPQKMNFLTVFLLFTSILLAYQGVVLSRSPNEMGKCGFTKSTPFFGSLIGTKDKLEYQFNIDFLYFNMVYNETLFYPTNKLERLDNNDFKFASNAYLGIEGPTNKYNGVYVKYKAPIIPNFAYITEADQGASLGFYPNDGNQFVLSMIFTSIYNFLNLHFYCGSQYRNQAISIYFNGYQDYMDFEIGIIAEDELPADYKTNTIAYRLKQEYVVGQRESIYLDVCRDAIYTNDLSRCTDLFVTRPDGAYIKRIIDPYSEFYEYLNKCDCISFEVGY